MRDLMWPIDYTGKLICDSVHFFEYGKDNYWTWEKMVEHPIRVVLPIFKLGFPGCQVLFAFDNASNYCCFAADTLVASKMNCNLGGSQPHMGERFIHSKQSPHAMVFPANHPNLQL